MSEKYKNPIKKNKRKIKRVMQPSKIGDYLDNLLIDLANYQVRAKDISMEIDKLKKYGWQIEHNIKEIVNILKEHNIYKSVTEKLKL